MGFSDRLKYLRKNLGLTQDDLAKSCNVQLTAISKYENGLVKPSFEMLSKIGLAFDVNLNWLVNEFGNIFLTSREKQIIKTGTDNFEVEVENKIPATVKSTETHSIELENDVKVEYYEPDKENYTKIYHKNGEVEYQSTLEFEHYMQYILEKIQTVCKDKNQMEFIMTAINSIEDEKSLQELKTLIKGMEILKK